MHNLAQTVKEYTYHLAHIDSTKPELGSFGLGKLNLHFVRLTALVVY